MSSPNPSPLPGRLSRARALTPAVRMGLSIAVATGLSVGQAMALSLLMFTGGSQFAFIGVIAGGGAASAALGAAALLGVRNAAYGMQMNRARAQRLAQRRGRAPGHR